MCLKNSTRTHTISPLFTLSSFFTKMEQRTLLLALGVLVAFTLSSVSGPPMPEGGSNAFDLTDFGRMKEHESPGSIMDPTNAGEVATLVRAVYESAEELTIAARGAAHSIYGQWHAPGGVVLNMRSLEKDVHIHHDGDDDGIVYVDVGGGVLWVDLLKHTLSHGLAPRSWTDYLSLTVGGTLSNAGISGQTFLHGPQISNVLELDVVTGRGEFYTCNPKLKADLFYSVLGGLGQFGIITRARIILEHAPHKVRWVRVLYDNMETFTRDQEALISENPHRVDYLEGFVVVNNGAFWSVKLPSSTNPHNGKFPQEGGSNQTYFCIEIGIYDYQPNTTTAVKDEVMGRILSSLNFIRSAVYYTDVSYMEFLNRVAAEEANLRNKGLWEVSHPWLNMFVPRRTIHRFLKSMLQIMPSNTLKGPLIVYPVHRNKWDGKSSAVVPEEEDEIFYATGILRSADRECVAGSACLREMERQNEELVDVASGAEIGAKQYLGHHRDRREWEKHFGTKWSRFVSRKRRYDPLNMLTPGQNIFTRRMPSSTGTDSATPLLTTRSNQIVFNKYRESIA